MEWLKPVQAFVARWWTYIEWCVNADTQAPVCRPFWTWVMIALLGIGALIIAWAVIKIISYKIKLAAALRAAEERMKVADEETMQAHTWKGDVAYQADVPAEDVRRRIKDALVERKNEGRPPPVV